MFPTAKKDCCKTGHCEKLRPQKSAPEKPATACRLGRRVSCRCMPTCRPPSLQRPISPAGASNQKRPGRPRRVQNILELYLPCLQHSTEKQGQIGRAHV